jgi:hypothetical protein
MSPVRKEKGGGGYPKSASSSTDPRRELAPSIPECTNSLLSSERKEYDTEGGGSPKSACR